MNVAQAAQLVRKYADEATGRLKPDEDGYMGADGRQLFETQPLDEFIVDIRKELLDVINYAAFGLHRFDDILVAVRRLEHVKLTLIDPKEAQELHARNVGRAVMESLGRLAEPPPPQRLPESDLDHPLLGNLEPDQADEVEAAVYSPSREMNRKFGEGLEAGLKAAQSGNLYAELHLQDPSLREAVLDISESDMEPLR